MRPYLSGNPSVKVGFFTDIVVSLIEISSNNMVESNLSKILFNLIYLSIFWIISDAEPWYYWEI